MSSSDSVRQLKVTNCLVRSPRRSSPVQHAPIPKDETQGKMIVSDIYKASLNSTCRRVDLSCSTSDFSLWIEFFSCSTWEDKTRESFSGSPRLLSFTYQKDDSVQFDLILSQAFVQCLYLAEKISQSSTFTSFLAQIEFYFRSVRFWSCQCLG